MSKEDRANKTNFLKAYETLCEQHSLIMDGRGDVLRIISVSGIDEGNGEIEAHMHMLWANTFEH